MILHFRLWLGSLVFLAFSQTCVFASGDATDAQWLKLINSGNYSQAVNVARQQGLPVIRLIQQAEDLGLSNTPMWRALLHYQETLSGNFLSQVDAEYFFLSETGKRDPQAELEATLVALFATEARSPLRLSAYCRFVARRVWLTEQLPLLTEVIPAQSCPEFDRYKTYLDAHTLTLIFPAAHPNSPSSAFGHTLIRIDKKDQPQETRLLNMSLNFAAEVPPEVSSLSYAVRGLGGGFQGKYRLLPYHIKLREYAQIENRDTWEYELDLTQAQVDLILRHAYEMLISYYDYYFLSENCSYHLLSLIDVAFADNPLASEFGLWTIPVDTLKLLRQRGLVTEGRFVPSTIRSVRARRNLLERDEQQLALSVWQQELTDLDAQLSKLPPQKQAGVLDLVADYNRYERLESDPGATAISEMERGVLSRRAKLGITSEQPDVVPPDLAPELGHETARINLRWLNRSEGGDQLELGFRPAYHDFRDPSKAYGTNAAIDFFSFTVARNLDTDEDFFRRLTLISIASIEPRGSFFKPVSWHTSLEWARPEAGARHQFTFNVGAGGAWQRAKHLPVFFAFAESDLVDDPTFDRRTFLRLGVSGGVHWQATPRWRLGAEFDARQQIGEDYQRGELQLWSSYALHNNLALVVDATTARESINAGDGSRASTVRDLVSAELRWYF